jgi:uncharacterized membrane protein required for colicin V production
MGAPALFDVLVVAPAAVLGLVGLWLGFWRAAVAWPMRWLIPLLGASASALLAVLYMAVNRELVDLVSLSGAVGSAVAAILAFAAALVLIAMFMRNLRERVAVWAGQRRTGLMGRLLGGLLGAACGLVLVALLYGVHDVLRPEIEGDAPWVEGSLTLPYLRGASAAVRGAVSAQASAPGRPRR